LAACGTPIGDWRSRVSANDVYFQTVGEFPALTIFLVNLPTALQ
jgi:hypothetical protein